MTTGARTSTWSGSNRADAGARCKLDTTTASSSLAADRVHVTKPVGDLVERSWMISVEDSRTAVTYPVGQPVDQTWMNFVSCFVHKNAACLPPHTVDVRPSCCARESFMTPRGC